VSLSQRQMASEYYDGDQWYDAAEVEYRDVIDDTTPGGGSADSAAAAAAFGRDSLMRFGVWYQGVHGYVCVVICLFGIVSNAMNIAVLTRRSMVCLYLLTYLITD